MFFTKHSQFLATSTVGNWPDRLNLRHQAIIESNAAALKDAAVLDIASHDGRWTFAAIDAGARHVTAVEVRADLAEASRANMTSFGIDPDKYSIVSGDVFEQPRVWSGTFDVVLCLGFLYHTTRHEELFERIRSTSARTVILDTALALGDGNHLEIGKERSDNPAHGMSERGVRNDAILYARPTRGAVSFMLEHFGYSVKSVDWPALIERAGVSADPTRVHGPDNAVGDYAAGKRGTFIATLD